MASIIKNIKSDNSLNDVYMPVFYRLGSTRDRAAMEELVKTENSLTVHDEIEGQLRELIKCNNPGLKIKPEEYPALVNEHLNGKDIEHYGLWVYYPWNKKLIHILDEEEFIEVRTNRNRYKITREEQLLLSEKTIGIVGLSVGQSIALTIALERICGEIRLADFDTAELSNLNRIRTGLCNLGMKKTVIAAREIKEIDPFLKLKLFNDGLNKENIDAFFTKDGRLDLLVEVCDGLDVKILSRFKARELKIPVLMDTNDRGMLDVERFDMEPDRPILHGLAGDLDPTRIANLTNEEKIPYILTMIGAETISTRLKASMLEVEQSINTWPQLASSVTLGGAVTTDVCRRIFLNQFHDSGRYYLDIDEMIKDASQQMNGHDVLKYTGPAKLTLDDLHKIADKYPARNEAMQIDEERLSMIIEAACLAPSGGNSQPWKFLFKHGNLFIFHDAYYSYSLLDLNKLGSYIAFGAMLVNIELKAASLQLSVHEDVFPIANDHRLIAVVSFLKQQADNKLIHLASVIGERMTSRNLAERKLLKEEDKSAIISIAATVPGASLQFFDSEAHITEFAEILTNTERIRFLHPQGHYDTFINELRFTPEEVEKTADGMDVKTLNMSASDIAALKIARDPAAIAFLHQLKKGTGFKKISHKNVLAASLIGVLSMSGDQSTGFLNGGKAFERIWLEATSRRISLQPISQIVFMTELLVNGAKVNFNAYEREELSAIHERFSRIIKLRNDAFPVIVFRLFYADTPAVRAMRRPLEEVLFFDQQ